MKIPSLNHFFKNRSYFRSMKRIFTNAGLRPKDPDYHNNIGMLYLGKGKYRRAIVDFEKAIELKPNDSLFLTNLSIAQRRLGKTEEALESVKLALAASPRDAVAHHTLGNTRVALNQLDEAMLAYLKALQIDSTLIMTTKDLISCLSELLVTTIKTPEDEQEFLQAQSDLENLTQDMTGQFIESINSGPDGDTDEKAGLVFTRWLVEHLGRIGENLPSSCPQLIRELLRLSFIAIHLKDIQESIRTTPDQD